MLLPWFEPASRPYCCRRLAGHRVLGSSRRSSQLHTLCKPKLAILGQIHPGASQTNVVPPILCDVEAAPLQYSSLSATPRSVALPLSLSPSDHRLGRLFSAESATSKVTLRSELVGHGETPMDGQAHAALWASVARSHHRDRSPPGPTADPDEEACAHGACVRPIACILGRNA